MRLQLELPMVGEMFSFDDLAAFVDQARAAGAGGGTKVELQAAPNTDDIPQCLEIEVGGAGAPWPSVAMDVALMRSVLATLEAAEALDGDLSHMRKEVSDVRRDLLDALLDALAGTPGPSRDDRDEDPRADV